MNLASSICYTRCYSCARIYTTISTTFLVANLKCRTVNINPTVLFLYHRFRNWLKKRENGLARVLFHLLSLLKAYLVYILQSMDLLCILVYKCKCLCDCELHNQHWQHSHRDPHTSHCGRQELWDILGQSNTHKAYILHRDCLCGLEDIGIWLCACSQCKRLWFHTAHKDKDPDTLFGCKLEWVGTHHHSYNQLNNC